jgi:hypothetical protein
MEASQWWGLFRLLQKNHVAALTAETVGMLPPEQKPPRDVLMPWLAESERARARYRFQCDVQRQIVDTMSAHGIETLVLKGTHTAQYYPEAEVRQFGDLDLYFFDRHDEADEVARRELHVQVDDHSHHHTRYALRGFTVESHYDFVNTHYPPSNQRYEAMLKELAPSPTFEVLFLLRHMAGHFAASRITLRDLVDWTLTCRAMEGQVDWEQVQRAVDDYGMTAFVSALDGIAERQLGYRPPLRSTGGPDNVGNIRQLERDIVYGSPETADKHADGLARLSWKLRRWKAQAWKRRMVFSDSEPTLLLASLTSHAEKPQSILHKM